MASGLQNQDFVLCTLARNLSPGTIQGADLDVQSPILFETNIPE